MIYDSRRSITFQFTRESSKLSYTISKIAKKSTIWSLNYMVIKKVSKKFIGNFVKVLEYVFSNWLKRGDIRTTKLVFKRVFGRENLQRNEYITTQNLSIHWKYEWINYLWIIDFGKWYFQNIWFWKSWISSQIKRLLIFEFYLMIDLGWIIFLVYFN